MGDARLAAERRSLRLQKKSSKRILARDAEKSDLIECTTINDLMLGRVE
jgi:hypothetical protein